MSKEWFTAAELAGLPGMPGTERGVRKAADRESWQSRKRERGKGLEYHLTSLPPDTQKHLRHQQAIAACNAATAAELAADPYLAAGRALGRTEAERVEAERNARLKAKEAGLKAFAGLPADHPRKRRALAREWVLRRWADFAQAHGVGTAACVEEFLRDYRAGVIVLPPVHEPWLPTRHGARSLDRATLYRWQAAYRAEGLAGLLDGYGTRKGQSKIAANEALRNVVLGCLLQAPHITPKKIKMYLKARHPALDIVSEKAIERFVKSWKAENAQLWTYLTNPDQWKNVYMAAFGSQHESIVALNQLWEMDSTPADWMLTDGRHVVIGVIDLYSRRLKFRVSKTSRAEAVALTFRDAVIAWGAPEAVRTDNGKDYVSEHFDRVLRDLEIGHELCLPFASEQKGTIERAMRTMLHGLLDLLPGFIGHNVAERKVIEARKSFAERVMKPGDVVEVRLSAAELQRKIDDWCEHVYAHDSHAGLDGKTPFEVAAAWRGPVRTIDPRALDLLLVEAGTSTVTKQGIRFEHHHYRAPELAAWIGQDVQRRRDPDDLGRLVVYSLEGAFICIAECHELLGISPAEVAAVTKATQKQLLAAQREELKDARRAVRENIAEAVLAHRIAQSAKLAALPKRTETYSTPALEGAAAAAQAQDAAPAADMTEAKEQARAKLAAAPAPVHQLPETPSQRDRRWVAMRARVQAGQALSEEERRFYEGYQNTPEWRAYRHMEAGLHAKEASTS